MVLFGLRRLRAGRGAGPNPGRPPIGGDGREDARGTRGSLGNLGHHEDDGIGIAGNRMREAGWILPPSAVFTMNRIHCEFRLS